MDCKCHKNNIIRSLKIWILRPQRSMAKTGKQNKSAALKYVQRWVIIGWLSSYGNSNSWGASECDRKFICVGPTNWLSQIYVR